MRRKAIERVKEYIERARELVPSVTDEQLDSNGAIYYMNGNDGTDFDWEVNCRLCEFMVFGLDGMGFVKVCINRSDVICGWIYENFGVCPTKTLKPEKLEDGSARALANFLYQVSDLRSRWDLPIDEFDFDEDVDDLSIFKD